MRAGGEFVFWFTEVDALMQVDDLAILEEARGEGFGQSRVSQEAGPLREIEIGGEDGAFAVAAVIHEAEEIVDLGGMRRVDISEFVDEQKIQAREMI